MPKEMLILTTEGTWVSKYLQEIGCHKAKMESWFVEYYIQSVLYSIWYAQFNFLSIF